VHLHEEGLDRAIEDQRVPQARCRISSGIAIPECEIPTPVLTVSLPNHPWPVTDFDCAGVVDVAMMLSLVLVSRHTRTAAGSRTAYTESRGMSWSRSNRAMPGDANQGKLAVACRCVRRSTSRAGRSPRTREPEHRVARTR
jgi:hypothetical protein